MLNDLRLAGLRLPGRWSAFAVVLMAVACLSLAGCGSSGSDGLNGADGADGADGAQGPPGPVGPPGPGGPNVINIAVEPYDYVAALEITSMITNVAMSPQPVVSFTVQVNGVGVTGIGDFWNDSNRFVRFTITKLVPGQDGDPDAWAAYVRDGGEPDYDTGNLVDHGDGTYTFTFLTNVTTVPGVPYEPSLTHRVAGQVGSSATPMNPQNMVYDFVPSGAPVSTTRKVATMESCNECHDGLVFHGRRFLVEYCVQCHNEDLAEGEGQFAFMIHRIHAGGEFQVMTDHGAPLTFEEVTYPQDLENCTKCHDGTDAATPDGDNWKNVPSKHACSGCHAGVEQGNHPLFDPPNNQQCSTCHTADGIAAKHATQNATMHNPQLPDGQVAITYEMVGATVDLGTNEVVVQFRLLADGTPLDPTNLPADILTGGRYPGLLLAYALPQDDIEEPGDFNNLGRTSAQPISIGLDAFDPITPESGAGTIAFDGGTGIVTVVIEDPDLQFPEGATMRTVGLQGYFRQWIEDDQGDPWRVNCHTPSVVTTVTGDTARREVVDNTKCASCHEWFEGHGGNRVYNIAICTMCHVPNLSSTGRALDPPPSSITDILGSDTSTYPEDAQNLKDMIHGIHASDFRTRAFTHVRGGSHSGYYDWSEVTFPARNGTRNCLLCHKSGTYELPLATNLLPTTVRTTDTWDGDDEVPDGAQYAFDNVPNGTDWINTPTSSSCFYCHTSTEAGVHMEQNGGLLSFPGGEHWYVRWDLYEGPPESCTVCHGPGKAFAVDVMHGLK